MYHLLVQDHMHVACIELDGAGKASLDFPIFISLFEYFYQQASHVKQTDSSSEPSTSDTTKDGDGASVEIDSSDGVDRASALNDASLMASLRNTEQDIESEMSIKQTKKAADEAAKQQYNEQESQKRKVYQRMVTSESPNEPHIAQMSPTLDNSEIEHTAISNDSSTSDVRRAAHDEVVGDGDNNIEGSSIAEERGERQEDTVERGDDGCDGAQGSDGTRERIDDDGNNQDMDMCLKSVELANEIVEQKQELYRNDNWRPKAARELSLEIEKEVYDEFNSDDDLDLETTSSTKSGSHTGESELVKAILVFVFIYMRKAASRATKHSVHLACLPAYWPACQPTYLSCKPSNQAFCAPCVPACLPAYLPACLSASLPACLPACQPTCLPASLPAYLLASLPTCLPARLPARLSACLSLVGARARIPNFSCSFI
jgi:hypothetical protein